MRKQIKIKQLVAILLPIVFILGIVYAIPNMISLRADDSSSQLTVQKGDEDITGKEISISDTEVKLKLTASANQLYQLPKNEKLSVASASSDSRDLPIREVTSSDFDLEKELTDLKENKTNEGKSGNELIRVLDVEKNKSKLYLKLLKDQPETMTFAREHSGIESVVEIENVEARSKQKLFVFSSPELGDTDEKEEASEGNETFEEPKEDVTEPLRGDESFNELEEREYSKKESFKPIELPLEESDVKKSTKGASSVKVTGAKLSVRSGTKKFDSTNSPGYDKDADNEWVRSYDSSIYILSFSLEGSNPGIKYTDIKYRVDMDLPNAFGFDSAGKQRENFGIEAESTEGLKTEADGTKTDNGYVESTINSNGQILLPIFVNVFGAQHNTPINPVFKITVISAKNANTGVVETINRVYDKTDLTGLIVPTKKVTAQPNLVANITKGEQAPFGSTISGSGWTAADKTSRNNWQVAGIGVYVRLKELTGRDAGDYRGSTFPATDVEIELKTLDNRYKPSSASSGGGYTSGISSDPVNIIAGRWASTDNTASTWSWRKHNSIGRTLNINKNALPLNIPYGKGLQALKQEPSPSLDKSKLGAYDTGDVTIPTTSTIKLSAHPTKGYQPVWNQYTYMMNKETVDRNKKVFASTSLFVEWSNAYFANKTDHAKTYQTDIAIGNITYEGKSHSGRDIVNKDTGELEKQTLSVTTDPGTISQHIPFTFSHNQETGEQGKVIGGPDSYWNGAGTTKIAKGYEFTISVRYSDQEPTSTKEAEIFARWNANSIEYDDSNGKKTMISPGGDMSYTWVYGVRKDGSGNPVMGSRNQSNLTNDYNWYTTVSAAKLAGKISALRIQGGAGARSFNLQIPVKAVGPINSSKDSSGNPNVALMNSFVKGLDSSKNYDSSNHVGYKFERPQSRVGRYYEPSRFTSSGAKNGGHFITNNGTTDLGQAGSQAAAGDSLWIMGVGITTTTKPDNPTYKTSEIVPWEVTGNISGGNTRHTAKLTTTIPAGLKLDTTSGKYYDYTSSTFKSITPVKKATNPDGSIIYEWTVSGINPALGQKAQIIFDTKPAVENLTFTDSSVAEAEIKTVGEVWITSNPSEKDISETKIRESSGKVQLYQIQQISLEKSVVPDYIEVGNKDAADPSLTNDIKYKIKLTNNSSDELANIRVMDVLPRTGSLGNVLSGTHIVKDVKFTKNSGTIRYNTSLPSDAETNDPNKVTLSTSWKTHTSGSGGTAINSAKAILIIKDKMAVDEELEFEIIISPTGQKAGDIFRNQAAFNSHLDLPVKSNIVETKVYGRDLTGYVWYDDDYDGLIGTKKDGTPEDPVANIPVKLYRTSQENGVYKKQLVKQSLTGKAFVDGSGNSLIKTGTDGKYKFEDLPEGEYIAEFIVNDIVVTKKVAIVTKQLVGSDMTLNSKADPASPFRTPEKKSDGTPFYKHPILSDLPTLLTGTDKVHHITDVNAGLTRLSKIKLFKYEEGTAVDQNNDGKLSEKEIEDSATALEYAEFDIYKGKSDKPDPSDKLNSTPLVTDSKGWLEFGGLPPGDYTIIETKAPPGFELIKEPIYVNVPTYNYIAVVHVADKGQTKLPFTGSTKAARIVLIASATLFVIGMVGVFLQFRPTKAKGGR